MASTAAILRHDTVRSVRATASRAAPPYYWLGADADRIAAPINGVGPGPKPAAPRPQRTIPLYHWLGADADSIT
jgi:hypothetical protein